VYILLLSGYRVKNLLENTDGGRLAGEDDGDGDDENNCRKGGGEEAKQQE